MRVTTRSRKILTSSPRTSRWNRRTAQGQEDRPRESIVGDWWLTNKAKFPNREVMARQYLGVPASSASVSERLFSAVGIAYSAKRQSADAKTVADIMFTKTNLPSRARRRSNIVMPRISISIIIPDIN